MAGGQLRVYLGAAPGVGKTFAMLEEGHRRRDRGTDVVVGYVETHGRARTAEAAVGLETVPRLAVRYRGVETTEMDLPALLTRRPDVALVDELAHTNAYDAEQLAARPGSQAKRWQDVQQLLDAGIDVVTTVNVQHLESLNDVVQAITGIRQTETVPDAFVRAAAAVELVDMSPQSLQRRMAHGNIYAADKVEHALTHYFREGNLAALRELALLWLADRVDEGLDRYRAAHGIDTTWATRERVVVAVSGGEESVALLRRAARIASRSSSGEWRAVYVTRRDGLSGVTAVQLDRLRAKTVELGGTFHAVVAADAAEGLLDFARGVNATQVLLGASRRSRWATLLRPGLGEVVIAESGDIDVHVVTHAYARHGTGTGRRRGTVGRRRLVGGYLMALLGTALLSAGLALTPDLHGLPTESMLLMALVVATALVGGLWPAVTAAVLGGLSLNYLFVAPTGTLTIADPENALAIGLFLVTGVAVASVVDRAARRTAQATRARTEANALAVLSHTLLHTGDDQAQLLNRVCEVFGMTGAAVQRRDGDEIVVEATVGNAPDRAAEADADIVVSPEVTVLFRGHALDAADRRLLSAYAAHFAVVRERREALAESRRVAELAEGNRTRTALLAAVSHDLRTPLAAIKAAVSSVRDTSVAWSPDDEAELLATIEASADRLDTLVGNLLDLSRLQMGSINPLLDEVDLASAATWALEPLAGRERVRLALADDARTAHTDPGLLDRVLANLLENALRYTPAGSVVEVTSAAEPGPEPRVLLAVRDHGPGIPAGSRAALFAPFQRLGDVPHGDGLGLGLAVARGLAEAMGGRLGAGDTPGGGLTMVVDLPATAPRPAPAAKPPAQRPVSA
jgi:two-component system sensor histidine kinase KdpD